MDDSISLVNSIMNMNFWVDGNFILNRLYSKMFAMTYSKETTNNENLLKTILKSQKSSRVLY